MKKSREKHRKSSKISGLWFMVGQKNFRSQSTKKMRKDRWWSETRVFDIIKNSKNKVRVES